MPRVAGSIAVALLLTCAGCAGLGGSTTTTLTTTTAPDSSTTTTTTMTTATPTTTPTTTVPEAAVVSYDELSDRGKRFARWLVENGSLTAPPPELPPRLDHEEPVFEYLRYQGTLYELTYRSGDLVGSYGIAEIEQLNESDINFTAVRNDSDLQIVAYANLSARAKTIFDEAWTGGSETYYDFPEVFLPRGAIVRRNGTYYSVSLVIADAVQYRISVVPLGEE